MLDNSNPDSTLLDLTFDFYLINSGADIMPDEVVDIRKTFQNLEFQTVYGYAGTYDSLIIDNETLEFDFLDFDFEGTVKLYDPRLYLDIRNSFGLTFGIELLDMEASFAESPDLPITIDPADNPVIVNAPTLDQVGESVQTEVTIDRDNSNIHEIGTTDLRGLRYSIRALANPGGVTDNFLQDTSKMKVNFEAIIPIHLRIEDVVFRDTMEFNLSEDLDEEDIGPDDIKSMEMKLETSNGLPIDIEMQVYFADSTASTVLDSLFDDTNRNILPAGILNDEGRVIVRRSNTTEVTLTRAQIQNIWDSRNIIVEAVVETKDETGTIRDVKFYSEYSLYFKIGAGARVSIASD